LNGETTCYWLDGRNYGRGFTGCLVPFQLEPISKISFEEIFKYLTIMQDGFCSPYWRLSGQKSQRSRMGKGAENFQKVFLRRVLIDSTNNYQPVSGRIRLSFLRELAQASALSSEESNDNL
jgi:hypothetical protein